MHEFKTLYPRMMEQARKDQEQGAEINFNHAREVDGYHHELFEEALKNPEEFPVQDYFICNACSSLATGEPPERCPVCGTVQKGLRRLAPEGGGLFSLDRSLFKERRHQGGVEDRPGYNEPRCLCPYSAMDDEKGNQRNR